MEKTVKPPILMSRMLTFVLSASIVVLGVLVFTLFKMAPLERPEVFFLYTPTRSANVIIDPIVPDASNKEILAAYQKGFVREYVNARNTITTSPNIMRKNWSKIIKPWSSNEVFKDLTQTRLYREFSLSDKLSDISCRVDFSDSANKNTIVRTTSDTYNVNFTWICENIGGQTTQKNYRIQIKIQSNLDGKISGTLDNLEKLRNNPLGIQVVQYKVLDGRTDPLDSDMKSWESFEKGL